MTTRIAITSPVGRIVGGNLYEPRTKDYDGKPLVIKTGPNAGQPRVKYFFALAIPKGVETHWALTEWGKQIWQVGHEAFPQAAQRPDFAWKIEDGDSLVPNKKGRTRAEQEGWKGHWVIRLESGFAPKIYRQEGAGYVQVMDKNAVKAGYYVEVNFTVSGNENQNNSGVYLNIGLVCFRGYGDEISFGSDVDSAGFGTAPLPTGASLTPLASTAPLPAAPAAAPGGYAGPPAPPAPPAPLPTYAGPAPLPGSPLPTAPIPVIPSPRFVQALPPGVVSPAPGVIPQPPAIASLSSPVYVMTAKAAGASQEAYHQAGWSDAQLIAGGYMVQQ